MVGCKYNISHVIISQKLNFATYVHLWSEQPPFRLTASVSWCWSWQKEGRAIEVVPGI